MRALITLLLALGFSQAATADAPATPANTVYGPVGAPKEPKLPIPWNTFRSYADATKLMQDLVKTFPQLCQLQSLGKSHGGRELWVLTITNAGRGSAETKPAMWIDGGIHANEIQAVDVVLYTAWFLAESYGKNPFVTRLLDERAFYLMPMLSPDSREAHMVEPNTTHSPRSGQRPHDDDRDGLVDEDGPDDLDGDGHIVQMRRRDPHGRYKPHPKYPQWLIEAEPDEPGEFTLLGSEGIDNDKDGKVNEDGDGYYDPNRDWAWNWQPSYVQRGAFRYPFSLIENRVAADFIMARPNIAAAQSYHNTGGMILRGPGSADDKFPAADMAVLEAIGARGEAMLPGYRSLNIATGLYTVYGGEVDWLMAMQGIFTFTNELFTPFNLFREPSAKANFSDQESLRKFDRFLLFGEGTIPWHEVDHPIHGKIEVGGFTKNWVRQPPSFLLEEECHRNMAFTLYHADQMPMVAISSLTIGEPQDGIRQVTATIANLRMIPTRSAHDVAKRITRPDRVSLSGEKAQVLASLWSKSPTFEAAQITKREPAQVEVDAVPGMGAVYVRWFIRGEGPLTIRIESVKGGAASLSR